VLVGAGWAALILGIRYLRSLLLRWLRRGFLWGGDAFDDDALGFEVRDTVFGAVAHEDRFLEESDERAGVFGEPAGGGLVPVDGEVVGGVTLGTGERSFQPAVEGSGGELADGVGAGADGCYAEIHRWGQGSTGVVVVNGGGSCNDNCNCRNNCNDKYRGPSLRSG
jgi:hypothetical protein